ncbi:MAG: hypothetical protein PHE49_02735 [bacterium]|nr:hypothetical protein [bacterium]
MNTKIFYVFCISILITQSGVLTNSCFAKSNSTASVIDSKMFIPGLPQLEKGETIKSYGIMGGEAVTLLSGLIFMVSSSSEYSKYKGLGATATPAEFDSHYNKSNSYGTMSIASFVLMGGIYAYSVADAMFLSKPAVVKKHYKKIKKYGLYFEPQGNGIALCARRTYE